MWKPVSMAVLLVACVCSTAHAGIMVSFASNGVAPLPSTINLGGTVDLDVYLVYDGAGTNYLNEGLVTAGIKVSYGPAGIVDVDPFTSAFGGGWDLFSSGMTTNNFAGETGIAADVGLFGTPLTGTSIHLATLRFTGMTAGTATVSFSDLTANPFVDTVTDLPNSTVLDNLLTYTQTTQITVLPAAVPEPLAGIPLSLLLGGYVLNRRMRARHSGRNRQPESI